MRPTSTHTERKEIKKKKKEETPLKERERGREMAGHLRCKMNEIIADWMSNAFRPTPFDSTRLKLTNRVCRSTDGRFRPDENRQIRHVWSFLSSLATFNLFLLFLLSLLLRLIPFHRSSSSSSTGHPPARRRARFYSFVFFSLSFFFQGRKTHLRHAIRRRLWFITSRCGWGSANSAPQFSSSIFIGYFDQGTRPFPDIGDPRHKMKIFETKRVWTAAVLIK